MLSRQPVGQDGRIAAKERVSLFRARGRPRPGAREFNLPATTDWRKISFLFNSLTNARVNLYAGVWEGKAGRVWLDDWAIEDAGPVNVLHRPGTPVTVQSRDGATTYAEGRDYAPLNSPGFNVYRGDSVAAELKLLPGSRITDGERLRVSWYHPLLIHDSQVTTCMASRNYMPFSITRRNCWRNDSSPRACC